VGLSAPIRCPIIRNAFVSDESVTLAFSGLSHAGVGSAMSGPGIRLPPAVPPPLRDHARLQTFAPPDPDRPVRAPVAGRVRSGPLRVPDPDGLESLHASD